MKRITMVAGEASGDNLGANLIRAMRQHNFEFEVSGICGPEMIAEGAKALYTIDAINSIGLEGLFGRIRKILNIRKRLIGDLLTQKPDIYIGIDAPDFNLGIERKLKDRGIPTVQYVAPTIWAWRGYRIHKIKRAVTRILTIYPFESRLYERAKIPFTYVGHPLADEITMNEAVELRKKFGYQQKDTVIAILPGSRVSEVKRLASVFVQTALKLSESDERMKFITPTASEEVHNVFTNVVQAIAPSLDIQIVQRNSLDVMAAADVVLLASGTAALEAALSRRPVVVAYRVSVMSMILLKMLRHVDHYSVLNHLGTTPVIPEFMQENCTVENLTREVNKYLENARYRDQILNRFDEFRRLLQRGASARAANEIMKILEA